MDATTDADIIRRRADRIATLVRDNRDLLVRAGVADVNEIIRHIRAEGVKAVQNCLRPYEALPYADRLAGRLARRADRLTDTHVEGHGRRATITTRSGGGPAAADGDNLLRMASRITLDILADRDDDPLFDIR